ncbi:hypothetical protein AC628_22895 [Bradyrhizobium sp. NAS96.2]|nr:hypothetical protein AC628_22895 [Bradyrhizobium sp. NAS96.2]
MFGILDRESILIVVPAKAGTHYPKCALLRDAGPTISFTIKSGGYGSWPSRPCKKSARRGEY